MANASQKRQAQANRDLSAQSNRVSAFIYFACFAFFYVGRRRYVSEFSFCIPGLFSQYTSNSWCKPKFDANGQLVSAGTDIHQAGLVEYVKDVMYLTWACVLLSVAVGIQAWLTLLVVPAFAGYKAFQSLKAGKELFSGGAQPQAVQQPVEAEPSQPAQKQKIKKRYI